LCLQDFSRPILGVLCAIFSGIVCTFMRLSRGSAPICAMAELGRARAEGWVVVLNDVTQLKELDRPEKSKWCR